MSNLYFPLANLPVLRLIRRTMVARTSVTEADSGAEYRIARYSAPRYRWEFELDTRDHLYERAEIEGFWNEHDGMRDSFLLVDPVDGVTRRVRFDDDELTVERINGNVYSMRFDLVSVFS